MKNLKKVLSLVLAFTLLLGVMVVSTGAANFTDNDEIENTEAVDTMVALNIINGKGDGSYFDPTGIVTRAEMAKMICVALNGGKDPQLGATSYSYTDTTGNWAAGYIEYCTNLGIVSGRGNGIFDPTGTVTGTEAAKMLLVAIGYDAAAEGFTGATWAIAVNVKANQKDLYEDLGGMDPSAGLTRDNAAQMVYNAIQATMVKYTYQLVAGTNGSLSTVAVAEDVTGTDTTILEKKFDMQTVYGYMDGISYDDEEGKYTYSINSAAAFGSPAITGDDASGDTSFTTAKDFSSLYAMQVKVLYKSNSSKTVYGMYAEDSSVQLSSISGKLPGCTSTATSVKVSSVTYKLSDTAGNVPVFAFNASSSSTSLYDLDASSASNAFAFNLIDNDGDGKGDVVVVYPFTVAKVTYVGSTTATVGNVSYKFEDCDIYDGIAKGDYAIVYDAANTAKGIDTLVKATEVNGNVTSMDSSTTVAIDGTNYKKDDACISYDTFKLGSTYSLIVVNGYYFYGEKTSTAASSQNVCLVNAVGAVDSISDTLKTQLLFADGTKSTIYVESVDGTDVYDSSTTPDTDNTNLVAVGKIYTYDVNSDGYYELTPIASGDYDAAVTAATVKTIKDGKATVTAGTGDSGAYYFADDAVVFYTNSSNVYKVTTGATANNWADMAPNSPYYTGCALYANKSNGFNYTELAYLNIAATPDSGDMSYGWITASPTLVKDGDDYYLKLTIWDGSTTSTYLADNYYNASASGTVTTSYVSVASDTLTTTAKTPTYIIKGAPVVFSDNGDGTITNVYSFKATANAVVGYADGADDVAFASATNTGSQTLTLTDDTVYLYVDTDNNAGVAGGSITTANEPIPDYYVKNCYVLGNTSDEVKVIVVDTANDLAQNGSTLGTFGASGTVTAFSSTNDTVTIGANTAAATVVTDLMAAFPGSAGAQLNDTNSDGNSDANETVTLMAQDGTIFIYTIAVAP